MHELSIASEIYRVAREAVAQYGPGRVETVRVAVGELRAIEPDLLKFAWEALVTGSPDQSSYLDVMWCPAKQYCEQCAAEKRREPGSWLALCPDCQHPLRIEGGMELDLLQVTYLTEDEIREAGQPAQAGAEPAAEISRD
ncbi:MAG: hydrogenase maturation nickel metallochaperone HypA [Acidobacteriota bacterium]